MVLSANGIVLPAIIHDRIDYAAFMVDGRTVDEMNSYIPTTTAHIRLEFMAFFAKGTATPTSDTKVRKSSPDIDPCGTNNVALNFSVPADFKRRFRMFYASHN